MVKVALDAGHGYNTAGKRTPDGEREWSFNSKVVEAAIKYLKQYKDVEVLRLDDPTGKTDVPLSTRTNKANQWGADILISYHHNAYLGKWGSHTGTETYTYLGSWPQAEKLAGIIQKHVVKAYGLNDRGLKKANFHMVRESKMAAILVEGGYMDSTIDVKKLRDDEVLDAAGKAVADGVAEYFGLKKDVAVSESKPSASKPVEFTSAETYKVVITLDGYTTAANAKNRKDKRSKVSAGTYHVFNKSDGMVNITSKKGVPGSWINPADNKTESKPIAKTFLIRTKPSSLWYYNRPDWNAKVGTVKKGTVLTVVDTLTVNGSLMYKLKSGTYITANPQYVNRV